MLAEHKYDRIPSFQGYYMYLSTFPSEPQSESIVVQLLSPKHIKQA